MKYLIPLFFLYCWPVLLVAQQAINADSLLQELAQAPKDTNKVRLYETLASHFLQTSIDSTLLFSKKGIKLASELDFPKGLMGCLNVTGNYYERKTQYDSAMLYYNRALDISQEQNDYKGLATVLNNQAIVYTNKGEYDQAMQLYFEALEAEEKLGNERGIAEAYNNIGVVFFYLQNLEKTELYWKKAFEIEKRLGLKDLLKKGYINMGAVYSYQKQYENALDYYHKAHLISTELGDQRDLSISLSNLAEVHYNMEQYDSATYYQNKAIALKEKIGDYRAAAFSYYQFANIEKAKGNIAKAEAFYLKSLDIAKQNELKRVEVETYAQLAELFKAAGWVERAYDYLAQHILAKDSLFTQQQSRLAAEAEAKYESKKKENEILAQRAKIAEKDLSLARKNRQIILFSAVGLVILLLAVLFISRQRLRNQKLQKENQLKDALAKIELQQQLENQRNKISRELHDNIASQLSFVISSVQNLKYAFQLKDPKKLQKIQSISNFTKTTAQELRDTIWAMNKGFISFEDMQQRLQDYLSKAEEMSSEIEFAFDWEPKISADYEFSALAGMNIYRIVQEVVHNSLKYAAASKIGVHIHESKGVFRILIEDNGQGFDPEQIERGHGLFNMEKRAEEIGARLELESRPGAGTKISLQLSPKHTAH